MYLFAGILMQNKEYAWLCVFTDGLGVPTYSHLHRCISSLVISLSWVCDWFFSFFYVCVHMLEWLCIILRVRHISFIQCIPQPMWLKQQHGSTFAVLLTCSTNLSDNIFSYAKNANERKKCLSQISTFSFLCDLICSGLFFSSFAITFASQRSEGNRLII